MIELRKNRDAQRMGWWIKFRGTMGFNLSVFGRFTQPALYTSDNEGPVERFRKSAVTLAGNRCKIRYRYPTKVFRQRLRT